VSKTILLRKLGSFAYKRAIYSRSALIRTVFRKIRRVILRVFGDVSCRFIIDGVSIVFPLSHSLPEYLATFKFYDRLLGRVVKFMQAQNQKVCCIDVGANIGDSILFLLAQAASDDKYLAIEASETFFDYLNLNIGSDNRITSVCVACAEADKYVAGEIVEAHGTGEIIATKKESILHLRSIDSLVKQYADFQYVNLVKVDTDGFDFDVLRGAVDVISKNMPIIMFECALKYYDDPLRKFQDALFALYACGYENVLVYDNFGYLLCVLNLSDEDNKRILAINQMIGHFAYFDVLAIHGDDFHEFVESEISFFRKFARPNKSHSGNLAGQA
jgi:FkbM family methyltransferase